MRTLALLAVLFSVGCATPYQPAGFRGGYDESRLGPDAFTVRFHGNAFIGSSRVSDFTMLRAAELTLESGYRYFVLLGETDRTSEHRSLNTRSNGGGGFNTTENVYIKPGQEMRVQCLMDKPKGGAYAYDARFISREMRRKYVLGPRVD